MSSSAITGLAKLLVSDASRFGSECSDSYEQGASGTSHRVSRTSPGPGDSLALDVMCRMAMEKRLTEGYQEDPAVVVDRETVADEFLGFLYIKKMFLVCCGYSCVYVMVCFVMSCYAMLFYVMLWYSMSSWLCYVTSCYVMVSATLLHVICCMLYRLSLYVLCSVPCFIVTY